MRVFELASEVFLGRMMASLYHPRELPAPTAQVKDKVAISQDLRGGVGKKAEKRGAVLLVVCCLETDARMRVCLRGVCDVCGSFGFRGSGVCGDGKHKRNRAGDSTTSPAQWRACHHGLQKHRPCQRATSRVGETVPRNHWQGP